MNHYDYLIVGAGLYGAVFAQQAKKAGKTCLVIDKRGHIAGNIYTEEVEGIQVHRYGAHIFHTSNKAVWQYVNQFAEFNRYTNSPVANYHGEIYNLPFNMNTFNKMWGVVTPAEAKAKIEEQKREAGITDPKNLEEQAISLVGTDIYEKLIKGYTGKQWGRPCTELPAFIIKRLPVRFTYDNNYFNALYQGIPDGGYTAMVEKMLEGIEVRLNVDYLADRENLNALADKVVYTGPVDAYFGYRLGALQYRSVRFETEVLDTDNYQGNAVVNYTDAETGATLLSKLKEEGGQWIEQIDIANLWIGNQGGSLGEVGAIALLIGFAYLLYRKIISWHIPVSILLTVFLFSFVLACGQETGNPQNIPMWQHAFDFALIQLLSGGLLLGAIYMATDYVTSPMTSKGMIIYGIGIGILTVVIRQWGGYPEGVSFAILIMNAFTPLINNYIKPKRFGNHRS